MATMHSDGLGKLGCRFLVKSMTNEIFPLIDKHIMEKLADKFSFEIWENVDSSNVAIRLVTAWNTTQDEVGAFLSEYSQLAVN
jgi:threonine aldolase